jgi:hypothetical protein
MRATLGNQRATTTCRGSHLLSGHTHTLPDDNSRATTNAHI